MLETLIPSTGLLLPDLSKQYRDFRTKMFLIHKDASLLDVLVVPFGDDLKQKHDTNIYIRFLPEGKNRTAAMNDAVTQEHQGRHGRYLTVSNEEQTCVLPFQTYTTFPYCYMGNEFTKTIARCQEKFLGMLIAAFGELGKAKIIMKNGMMEKIREKGFRGISELPPLMEEFKQKTKEATETLTALVYNAFQPLETTVRDAFAEEKNPSQPLPRMERRFQHLMIPSIESAFLKPPTAMTRKEARLQRMQFVLQHMVEYPLRHSIATAAEKEFWLYGKKITPRLVRTHDAFMRLLEERNADAYDMFRSIIEGINRSAGILYRMELFAAGMLAYTFGFPYASAFLGLCFAEYLCGRYSRKHAGWDVSLIGTVREKLGAAPDLGEMRTRISDEFHIGHWKSEDFT